MLLRRGAEVEQVSVCGEDVGCDGTGVGEVWEERGGGEARVGLT